MGIAGSSLYLTALLLLLQNYCEVGQCFCKRGFSKRKIEAVVDPCVSEGDMIVEVQFRDCALENNVQFRTSDSRFEVDTVGVVHASRTLTIGSKLKFSVLADDLETCETWRVDIQLSPLKNTELVERALKVIHFPKKRSSRRQKREWVIPPLDVREHEPPKHLNPIAVIRSDAEDMPGVTVTYHITGKGATEPPINLFIIDPRTGELNITGEVDREVNAFFKLTGQAYDQNRKPREKPIELVVKVLDINDNPPVFTKQVFQGSVEELSQFGTSVLQLTATDADEGENAIIHYRIIKQGIKEEFTATANGEIKVTSQNLDRETQDFYSFILEARDLKGNSQGLTATATAQIKILDVNDNIPTVEYFEYEVSVKENLKNIQVIRIKVTDKDEEFSDNWLAHFDIIDGNEGEYFRIEVDNRTNEGTLIIQKELNYEEVKQVNLFIRVSNKAPFHSSVSTSSIVRPIKIKLIVTDVPEGYEFRPSRWMVTFTESTTGKLVHKVLGKYPAVSADTGKQSKMTKYAKDIDAANWLVINPDTGEVTFNGILDRESRYVTNGTYTATILAINNERTPASTSTGTIVIRMQDANDHRPNFVDLHPCMCSNAKSLSLTAFDADGPQYAAPFQFNLNSNPKWKLGRTNATSMELISVRDLWPGIFTVPISIKDNDGNGHLVTLNVHVIDCHESNRCKAEKLSQSSKVFLGAAAVSLMVLVLLLLLLVPLLLLLCQCGGGMGKRGFRVIPPEPVGSLAKCNFEGGGPVDTMVPIISHVGIADMIQQPASIDGAGTRKDAVSTGLKGSGDVVGPGDIAMDEFMRIIGKQIIWDDKEAKYNVSKTPRSQLVSVWDDRVWQSAPGTSAGGLACSQFSSGEKLWEGSCKTFIDEYIHKKLSLVSQREWESHSSRDVLLVYANEGTNSPCGSLVSCSCIEDAVRDDSFLNDLDSKFSNLAEICQSHHSASVKSASLGSTVAADPPIQVSYNMNEGSVWQEAVKLASTTHKVQEAPVQKHIVITTTISPSGKDTPAIADPMLIQQMAMANVQLGTEDMQGVTDPTLGQKTTKLNSAVDHAVGTVPSFSSVSVIQKSALVTSSVRSEMTEMQPMITEPSLGSVPILQKNVVVTRSVDTGTGPIQGGTTQPSAGQASLRRQVRVTQSGNSGMGDPQGLAADLSVGQVPVIQKNVVVGGSLHSGAGGIQGISMEPAIPKDLVTGPFGGGTYRSVKKVTKTVQLLQE
ncbi:desmoglein-2-like [Stegostoma tigrinum]|uniref:desmoglein-2-like n=1 Tax=Stegostoma tigrinum TaxID=3053191 RepID=UPI00202B6722|nr:desmoglein-2-like [Stegostoma tigrinum]